MKIGVIGAGSWGTAIAAILAEEAKNRVILWAFEPEVAAGINQRHQNPFYMTQAKLPAPLRATTKLSEAVEGSQVLVNVVPSHHTRAVWQQLVGEIKPQVIVVNASKGLELDSGKRLSQVLTESLPSHPADHFVVLSGPSFAAEVLAHQPTTVVVAGSNRAVAAKIQKLFRRPWFLTYLNEDQIGVEVGGALKNVIAIAAGICEGMKLGFNTRAALITRGLYEMTKLGKAMGANPLTFAGLSGMGDLVLTCTGPLSRNHSLGIRLGKGEKLAVVLKEMKNVAEGVKTAKVAYTLIQKHCINNPVFVKVYEILYQDKPPRQALKELLAIDLYEELGGLLT